MKGEEVEEERKTRRGGGRCRTGKAGVMIMLSERGKQE